MATLNSATSKCQLIRTYSLCPSQELHSIAYIKLQELCSQWLQLLVGSGMVHGRPLVRSACHIILMLCSVYVSLSPALHPSRGSD